MDLCRRGNSFAFPCSNDADSTMQNPETHEITDMFSYYSLPSTAMKTTPPSLINAAYLFYYATTSCPSCANLGDGSVATPVTNWKDETTEERATLKHRLLILICEALVLASQGGFDVFNALTLQDNALFLPELHVSRVDQLLHPDFKLTFSMHSLVAESTSLLPLITTYSLTLLPPQRIPAFLSLVSFSLLALASFSDSATRSSNYATKPILGGIDTADGGSGVGLVML